MMVNKTQGESEEEGGGRGGDNYTKASRYLIIKFSKTWEREKSQKEP